MPVCRSNNWIQCDNRRNTSIITNYTHHCLQVPVVLFLAWLGLACAFTSIFSLGAFRPELLHRLRRVTPDRKFRPLPPEHRLCLCSRLFDRVWARIFRRVVDEFSCHLIRSNFIAFIFFRFARCIIWIGFRHAGRVSSWTHPTT